MSTMSAALHIERLATGHAASLAAHSPDDKDARLIVLAAEFIAAEAATRKIIDAADYLPHDAAHDALDAQISAGLEAQTKRRSAAARIRATSPAGLRAKSVMILADADDGSSIDEHLTRSLLNDLMRIGVAE